MSRSFGAVDANSTLDKPVQVGSAVPRFKLGSYVSLAGLALTLALVTLVYAPTLGASFHGDDYVAFTEFKVKGFLEYSRDVFLWEDTNFYWRPLGDIFHYSLYAVFGLNPAVFRTAALVVFLATLICMYAFCRGERFGGWTAVGAALIFGMLPSHVVSVSWVTNTSRLTAALFLMLSLLALQRTRSSRRAPLWEIAAFLAFVIAVLNDEVTAALVGVPLFYATFVARNNLKLLPAVLRAFPYGAVVAMLVPLQFANTIDNEARLIEYGFGWHMPESFWVAASQLALPVAAGGPLDVYLHRFGPTQWAAGLVTLATLGWLILCGSRQTRFLAIWCLLAILPFSLWKPMNISPRYVFLAAMPFSILVAWALASLGSSIVALTSRPGLVPVAVRVAVASVALPVAAALLLTSSRAVETRNQAWTDEASRYGRLRSALEEWPELPEGSRVVIYYSDLPDFWATATARTLYGDPTLQVVNVPPRRVEAPLASQSNDVVFYMMGGRLLPTVARR